MIVQTVALGFTQNIFFHSLLQQIPQYSYHYNIDYVKHLSKTPKT